MWLTGVVGVGVLYAKGEMPLYFVALLLFMGLPRIVNTLRDRRLRNNVYYRIPLVQSVTMAVCYVSLAALLTGLFLWIGRPVIFG
jgi:hypothetical protein